MVMTLVMVGLGLAILMQLAIFCVAVKNSLGHALLCLFIPCYVYVYARKNRQARPFLWGWYAGIGLLAAGAIASN
ncbi:hypothetical protein HBJ59_29915 [Pseudomonas sp. AN3A02]|nr:hypothetical protein [Pseudomonas sp. AN3A02]